MSSSCFTVCNILLDVVYYWCKAEKLAVDKNLRPILLASIPPKLNIRAGSLRVLDVAHITPDRRASQLTAGFRDLPERRYYSRRRGLAPPAAGLRAHSHRIKSSPADVI